MYDNKKEPRKFYFCRTFGGEVIAQEMTLVTKRKKHCVDCGEERGVMFNDIGLLWVIDKELRPKEVYSTPGMECYKCLVTDPSLPFVQFKNGKLVHMHAGVFMLARDLHELAELVPMWKAGLRPNLVVTTPSGENLVVANPKGLPEPTDSRVKCPQCRETIVITVGC